MAGQIGHLGAGAVADITVLDLASTPAISQRSKRATDIWDALFPTIMMGDDRAIRDVWVAGERYTSPSVINN
jgi:guanine deaminase